jgi:hypothetical protein
MAARVAILHDFGGNAPSNWEYPFGSSDMHVALAIYSDNEQHLGEVPERARQSHHDLAHVSVVYRMRFNELPGGLNPFGFRDELHNPQVGGSVAGEHIALVQTASNPPIRGGEFVMGYPDELGQIAQAPIPEEYFPGFPKVPHGCRGVSQITCARRHSRPKKRSCSPPNGRPMAQRRALRTGARRRGSRSIFF